MQNSKIWFSRDRKELLKWNKKQVLSFTLKKETSKNAADTTFTLIFVAKYNAYYS